MEKKAKTTDEYIIIIFEHLRELYVDLAFVKDRLKTLEEIKRVEKESKGKR